MLPTEGERLRRKQIGEEHEEEQGEEGPDKSIRLISGELGEGDSAAVEPGEE